MALSAAVKLATSMYSPCGIHWALKLIFYAEEMDVGVNWSNLFSPVIEGDNISLGGVLLMMISSWFLWMLLILYLDAVIPWQYGMPKPPLFFLQHSYWFPKTTVSDKFELSDFEGSPNMASDMVERTDSKNVVIRLERVTHNFGHVRAVDNVSLDLYGNQITVLLGHNGAGKTTAMNILTGLFPPTRGDILINGYDVRKNTKKAREGVGLCPQHNVLFDDLTVEEHLNFFSMLKTSKPNASEVTVLLEKLELIGKASTLSKSLSGGMKRKLSLANAMVGGSPILILDEPSSGLDPEARRKVWDLLQQERTRRTILMTTHYMEEADVLGDRIAFIAKGKLMCAGSPMFLKRKFETGYKLRVTKIDQNLDPESIVSEIKSLLPESADKIHLVSDMSYEAVINIGFPGSVQMVSLFRQLEDNQQQLGVESLGVSVTTMEDVFLKVGQREEDLPVKEDQGKEAAVDVFESFPRFERLRGPSLLFRQMAALLLMRFHSLRRDWKIIGYMTLLPIIFSIVIAIILIPGGGVIRSNSITYDATSLLKDPKGFLAGDAQDSVGDLFEERLQKAKVRMESLSTLRTKSALDDAFLERADEDPTAYKFHTYAGMLKGSNSIYFNGQPYHVGAAALADWQAAQLKKLTGEDSYTTIENHPLDALSYVNPVQEKAQGIRLLLGVFTGLIFSYASCAIIIFPIQERVRKSKLIQIMSGVNPLVYIASNFAFDGLMMLISLLLCLFVFLCFNSLGALTTLAETMPAMFLIFVVFIVASTPWAYVSSYLFTNSSSGFSIYLTINFVATLLASVPLAILENLRAQIEGKADPYLYVLSFFPVFSASWSFATVYRNGCVKTVFDAVGAEKLCSADYRAEIISKFCGQCADGFCYKSHSVFDMDIYFGIGFQLISLTLMGLVGLLLLILIEFNSRRFVHMADSISIKKLFSCSRNQEKSEDFGEVQEDSAVKEERQMVHDLVTNNNIRSQALVAKDISKYYGNLRAVNDVSFHVKKNECFGLLGVNGAGKTTTFSMLTGDCMMSRGNSYIQHTDVRSKVHAYQEFIGYCPQFDALADLLTGREILSLFCGLRGVPTGVENTVIDFMITMADLRPHIDKLSQSYSGGNKRKLSLAIAMIGNPSILFLDEPSAGVDPGARRRIWATLVQAQKELNSSVLLTSHSMDECEALCHRLVIMLRGTFRCLGSSQQLKRRYGQGFTVLIKTKASEDDQAHLVQSAMLHLFGDQCELKGSYQVSSVFGHGHCLLQFHVNDQRLRWSEVFERIEKLRESPQLQLEDVQVSDTTLEQIFLNFAKEHAVVSPAQNSSV
ncbi:ATP-binding cassette sub-family A member 1 [Galendromus occidentalis]|uniref:ATP-binding cassette sub-family A member 1 n=1 Tax=Galendromus occidentalis TaxID=34638 RepID=A0AAJ7SEX4_9ACAR|nr:ATP-binding cassette sub-family A member 1 [Galendromus occidentalis]